MPLSTLPQARLEALRVGRGVKAAALALLLLGALLRCGWPDRLAAALLALLLVRCHLSSSEASCFDPHAPIVPYSLDHRENLGGFRTIVCLRKQTFPQVLVTGSAM